MIYNLNATGDYYVTPGIKVFTVDGGLEKILTPGTSAMIESGPFWMSGMIVGYKKGKLSVDVESTNTMKKDAYSETWNITVDSAYTNPASEEIIAGNYEIPTQSVNLPGYKYDIAPKPEEPPPENPYIKPDETFTETPFTAPETPFTSPETPFTTPETPVYTPPPVTTRPSPYVPPQTDPFHVTYKIPILVLLVALIIGIILFFVLKNKNSTPSVSNFISAFGQIW
jgi:hypothetical protein